MSARNPKNLGAAGEALRASELRYRRLFESAKDGILILDAETGMIVDVNPFLIELLGISRKAFLDKKVWYATLVYAGRIQLVLCTSANSLLSVVFEAGQVRTRIAEHLCNSLEPLLFDQSMNHL